MIRNNKKIIPTIPGVAITDKMMGCGMSTGRDTDKKLTSSESLPTCIWLIMEKGTAKRFCGLPKDSLNSLLLKPFFDSKIIRHFNRQDFHPRRIQML